MNINQELVEKLWNQRNPCHELNADTGKDMFFQTVLSVFNDCASLSTPTPKMIPVEELEAVIEKSLFCTHDGDAVVTTDDLRTLITKYK